MTTAVSPAPVSPRSSAWASSIGLSIVVHGAIVATGLFMAGLVARPTPLPVVAIDVVFASSGSGSPGEAKPTAGGVDEAVKEPIARPFQDPPAVPAPAEIAANSPPVIPVQEDDASSRPVKIERRARAEPPSIAAPPGAAREPEPGVEAKQGDPPPLETQPPPTASDAVLPVSTAAEDQDPVERVADPPSDPEPRPKPAPRRKPVSGQPEPPAPIATIVDRGSPVELVAESAKTLHRSPPEQPRTRTVPAPRSKPRRTPPPRRQPAPARAIFKAENASPRNPAVTPALSPAAAELHLAALAPDRAGKPSGGEGAGSAVPAALAGNRPPEYPLRARRRGWEGRVVLRVRVAITGEALSIEIKESSGYRLLDRAAEEAVRNWRFSPGRLVGIPVIAAVEVPIVFKLE